MYLLDTNIVIFLFKGHSQVFQRIEAVGLANCAVSEITVAELKYGAAKSCKVDYHQRLINDLLQEVCVIPISKSLDLYAEEKVRLEKQGTRIDDFDLLIATSAVQNKLIMVTNNTRHLARIKDIRIEDWTE